MKHTTVIVLLLIVLTVSSAPQSPARVAAYSPARPHISARVSVPVSVSLPFGDCGFVKYPVSDSGADGYCYTAPVSVPAVVSVPVSSAPAPAIVSPPAPPQDTPAPSPVDPAPVCKNKNALKEGTPDCNAGKGND